MRRQTLSALLRRSAARFRDKTALVCGATRWSYAEIDRIVDRLSDGLIREGIGKGDRVAVMARNSHGFVALRFAVARTGAVLVPINYMLGIEDSRYILEHSGATLIFADSTTLDVVRAAAPSTTPIFGLPLESSDSPPELRSWEALLGDPAPVEERADAGDLLQLIYTSGTEARPKGAMLTHDAVLWQYESCIVDLEWTADTVALHALPLYHCAQLDAMLGPALQVGATNIVTDLPTAENLIPLLSGHGVTSFFAPPTIWISLLRSPLFDSHDLSGLAKGYYGASIMPGEVLREMIERLPGLRLWNCYGQTEIAPLATVLRPEEHADRPGSCGRPVLNVATRVVDDEMRDVAPGEIGEVVHRSPQLMTGYWNDPERTAAAFEGGWFHSGDLARIDEQGYITIVDRKKDMIKTGGENVSSREVEEAVYTHPGVAEAAVIGLPDPRWIEAVTAVVVPRPGVVLDEAEILAHCRDILSSFKAPKRVLVVASLPRNASGKILKRELRLSIDN